jgi:hypothetical protein
MLNVTNQLYYLNEQDIVVRQRPKLVVGLAIATNLQGGLQAVCANSATKTECNSHPECHWSSGDCNDQGTGDWDQ